MIQQKILEDGRTYTWSDKDFKILQVDTGILYDDAVDSIYHEYEETDEPIERFEISQELP